MNQRIGNPTDTKMGLKTARMADQKNANNKKPIVIAMIITMKSLSLRSSFFENIFLPHSFQF
jgi:hypothetical protein